MSLTEEQLHAIEDLNTYNLVLAGPGTGKTKTLVEGVKKLLAEGVSPDKILVLAYNVKAAKEFKERGLHTVATHTFHSFAYQSISKSCDLKVIEGARETRIFKKFLKGKKIAAGKLLDSINLEIEKGLDVLNSDIEVLDAVQREAYNAYLEHLNSYKLISFTEILSIFYISLCKEKSWTQHPFREFALTHVIDFKFSYIFVDEAQDLNPLQINIIKELISTFGVHLFCIGDDDQSIYAWRGAKDAIFRIKDHLKDKIRITTLRQTFRFGEVIARTANRLIKHNFDRENKEIVPRTDTHRGSVKIIKVTDSEQEKEYIKKIILKIKPSLISGLTIGILCRYNELVIDIEEYLSREPLMEGIKTVSISTIHRAKGLEFDIVILPGWESGKFPFVKAPLEEERRLAYVAITRAKKKVYIIWCRYRNLARRGRVFKPSKFIKEISI